MKSSDVILHTLRATVGAFTVTATQCYDTSFGRGHFNYVVTNGAGDVLATVHSTGNQAQGKMSQDDLLGWLRLFVRDLEEDELALFTGEEWE